MTYQEKFVSVITSKGKILREERKDGSENILIPFGSEYGIRLKNLNTTRAVVSISIDGTDVLNGNQIVVEPNSSFELEGFLNDTEVKNKFKFIKKTKEISEHRGDREDDSLIRIEYQFEKQPVNYPKYVKTDAVSPNPWVKPNPWRQYGPIPPDIYGTFCDNDDVKSSCFNYGSGPAKSTDLDDLAKSIKSTGNPDFDNVLRSASDVKNLKCSGEIKTKGSVELQDFDSGITVKGSRTSQNFTTTTVKELEEQKHVLIFKLLGYTEKNKVVQEARTVKTKKVCETCARVNKNPNSKFCYNCGTSLDE